MKDVKIHGVPLFTFCARGFKMAPSIVYVLPSRADHVKTHNAQSVLIHISLGHHTVRTLEQKVSYSFKVF